MAYKSRRSALVPAVVREWAKENGFTVGSRGRLHADVVAAYLASQPKTLLTIAKEVGVQAPKTLKAGSKRVETLAAEVSVLVR